MITTRSSSLVLGCVLLASTGEASAQSFPPDSDWTPLPCGGVVMYDAFQDAQGFFSERDVVGNESEPAGYRASDGNFLYMRMRLDSDPASGGNLHPYSWGFEFDLDGNASTYELLILADGSADQVVLYRHTASSQPNDPSAAADQPPVAIYPFSTYGRTLPASRTAYGGDADYFIDVAVPWSALVPLGLTPSTPIRVWAASSSSNNALNGDFACYDESRSGAPRLTDIPTTPTAIDPAASPPGGVPLPGARAVEGGPACAMTGRRSSVFPLVMELIALLVLRARRGRRPD